MSKDHLVRHMRIYVGGFNLSGDARTFSSADLTHDRADMTGWSNGVRNFLANYRNIGIEGFQALLNDTATTGAFQVLKDTPSTRVSMLFGSGTVPAIDDPAYFLGAASMEDTAGFDGGAATIGASFVPDANQTIISFPWGEVLHPETSLSATTDGASVDNGASSANGGHANLHITATASGNFANKVQDSPDDSAWADLITFSADGSTVTSEQGSASGTVDRYTRFQATRTGGSETPVCVFARN